MIKGGNYNYSYYSLITLKVQNVHGYNFVLEHALNVQFAALDSSPFAELNDCNFVIIGL